MMPRAFRFLLTGLLLAGTAAVSAHDSWFEVQQRPGADDAAWTLSLGTGDRFPRLEFPLAAEYLVQSGCRSADGSPARLSDGGLAAGMQRWQVDARSGQATSCWVQSTGFDLVLEDDKIAAYLKEIQAGAELRATWAAMRSRGLAWRERYAKHARIELPGGDGTLAAPAPAGLAIEALLDAPGRRPLRGQPLAVTVLRDGRPLGGLPVEFVSERSRFGLWRRTDAQGRVEIALPFAGRWLLRGTDLRRSDTAPDTWDSRFVTLAFEVAEAQNGMNDRPNARSTNHAAASTAIASEPPTNTTRR